MKRTIDLCLCLLFLYGCENELEFKPKDSHPQLVMNALLQTEDTVHTVYFSISDVDHIQQAKNAEVSCYINDVLAAKSDSSQVDPSKKLHVYCTFPAVFHPGDKIRLEGKANGGALHATAEVIAPEAPSDIVGVDTLNVRRNDNGKLRNCMQFKIHIKDKAHEENHYRLSMHIDFVRYLHAEADRIHPTLDRQIQRSYPVVVDSKEDPILSDGQVLVNDNDDIWGTYVENIYTIFNDRQFKDGEATLKVFARSDHLLPSAYPWNDSSDDAFFYEPDKHGRRAYIYFNSERVTRKIKVSLRSMDDQYYRYLRVMNYLRYDNYEPALMEPVIIPNNVKEGLGFVGISTATYRYVELPEITYGTLYGQ